MRGCAGFAMGEYYDSGGNGLEYAVKTVKRSLCAVATAILIPVLLWAQQPELQVNTAGYRSLRTGVWLLLEKTGWHICLEEPIWPSGSADGAGGLSRFAEPVQDHLALSTELPGGSELSGRVHALVAAAHDRGRRPVRRAEEQDGVLRSGAAGGGPAARSAGSEIAGPIGYGGRPGGRPAGWSGGRKSGRLERWKTRTTLTTDKPCLRSTTCCSRCWCSHLSVLA